MQLLGGSLCSFLILSLSILSTYPVEATSAINAFTDTKCKVRPGRSQVGRADGFCQAIKTANTTSISIGSLDPGCTISFYSDPFCSHDATALYDGCGTLENKKQKIRSFSVDGCPPGTPGQTSSSSSTQLPSSTNSAGSSTSSAATETAQPQSSGPSAGVIGGAVGGSVAFLILAGIAAFFGRRHYKNSRAPPNLPPGHEGYTGDPELEANTSYYEPTVGGGVKHGGTNYPGGFSELQGTQPTPQELEAPLPLSPHKEKFTPISPTSPNGVEELPTLPQAPLPDPK